jgi:serine/threonine protein kinase
MRIPKHVIAHYANCEIKSEEEVVGWITVMERCETDLRKLLKERNENLTLEERKKISIGVKKGYEYMQNVGILHRDKKAENVLIKNGTPKWTDFGLIEENSGKESYRKMGYSRQGIKFRNSYFLCKFQIFIYDSETVAYF